MGKRTETVVMARPDNSVAIEINLVCAACNKSVVEPISEWYVLNGDYTYHAECGYIDMYPDEYNPDTSNPCGLCRTEVT